MIEDFNIRDTNWDLLYLHHLAYANVFHEVADILN